VTAVAEPQKTLQEQHPEAFAQMLRDQERFDATRPTCPHWCNGECETTAHFGTAVMHVAEATALTDSHRASHDCGVILIRAMRHESLDRPAEAQVGIYLDEADGAFPDSAEFTPAQAREFAAQLLRHADLLEPEQDLWAEDIRVGDLLPVGGEWLWVYSVNIDEPSGTVQVFTTVDRDEFPETNGDEEPHEFPLLAGVRIRREELR